MSRRTQKCPKCDRKITFWDIATALYPVWLKCKGCSSKLVGSRFIKIQGVAIPVVVVGIVVAIELRPTWDLFSVLMAIALLTFTVLMVFATLRFGCYQLRSKERNHSCTSNNKESEQGGDGDAEEAV